MGGNHDIYIIEMAGEFLVRPAVAMIDGSQKKLKIRNLTDYTAVLFFPVGFLENNNESLSITKKKKDIFNLNPVLDDSRAYQYSVVINKNGELVEAKGESRPSVIVDP